jgi:hypothetical protein
MTKWWAVGKETGRVYVRGHSHADISRWINNKMWEKPVWTRGHSGGISPIFEEPLIIERIGKQRTH